MTKFRIGATAFTEDGRRYLVDEVDAGIVYCSSPNGAETEFPEGQLLSEAEWAARSNAKRDDFYPRLKQSAVYTNAPGVERTAAEQMLLKLERLSPGLLDFVAYQVAVRILTETRQADLVAGLSIRKCRAIFEETSPATRAGLAAAALGLAPDVLVGAGRLGDNLMRALVEKGLAAHGDAFIAFQRRPRT